MTTIAKKGSSVKKLVSRKEKGPRRATERFPKSIFGTFTKTNRTAEYIAAPLNTLIGSLLSSREELKKRKIRKPVVMIIVKIVIFIFLS